jgi:hypothetical protein
VGWFAIACICGFLGYWGWQSLSNWLAKRNQIGSSEILTAVVAFGIVFAILILWASESALALVVGAGLLGYWEWRRLSNWLVRKCNITNGAAELSSAIIIVVVGGLALWRVWPPGGQIADALQYGWMARSLLGFVLGVLIGVAGAPIGVAVLGHRARQLLSSWLARIHITSDNAGIFAAVIAFTII